MQHAAEWTFADERDFRRSVILNAPERAARLEPMPAIDWLASMSIRELSPPRSEPYRGPERRRALMACPPVSDGRR